MKSFEEISIENVGVARTKHLEEIIKVKRGNNSKKKYFLL
jgi:hypothetical protein